MRPLELTFSGLRSYISRQHINFRGQSLVGITGETGAGKSSIFIAINFALFGACTFEAPTPKVLIADGGDGTLAVELVFEARGKEWKVSRRLSKKSANSHHRLEALDGSETRLGRDVTNTRIQQLIGLDQKTFVRSVLLRQGKFEQLLHASPAERAHMLKGLLGLDILDTIGRQARDRRDALAPHLHKLRERKAALLDDPRAAAAQAATQIGQADEQIEQLGAAQEQLAGIHARCVDAENERMRLLELIGKLASILDTDAPEQLKRLAELGDAVAVMDGALVGELTPLRQRRDGLLAQLGDRRPGGPLADVPATAATALGQLGELVEREADASSRFDTETAEMRAAESSVSGAREEAEKLATLRKDTEQDRKNAADREGDLERQLDAWRAGLRDVRELTARVTQLAQQLRDRQSDHVAAAEKLEQQRAAVEEAHQAVTSAEEAIEGQKRLNAAAYAAAGLQPGDACLICDHELPDGFVPPHAPGLHDAEQALKKARAHAKRKADLTTAALSKERETYTVAEQKAAQLTDTSEQARSALTVLTQQLGAIDLDRHDDHNLAPHIEALTAAREQTAAKAAYLEEIRNSAAKAAAIVEAIDKDIAGRTAQLKKIQIQVVALRKRITTLTQQIPAEYRPERPTTELVTRLRDQATADRLRLGEQWSTLTQLSTEIEALETRRDQLIEKRADQVTTPAKQSQQRMLDVSTGYAALAALLHTPPATQLDLTADLTAQAQWAADIKDLARGALDAGRARAGDVSSLLERLAIEAAAITSNAPTGGKPLHAAYDDAVGRRAIATKTHDTALTQIPVMDDMVRRIESTQPHLDGLTALVELLGNGKFGAAVVQERQQTLLGAATAIIRGMTLGRFAFGPDFQIFDAHTGSLRDVKTLSGGETFQASLALALAVVEQASSSGGKAESLFLDEGFGSLDQTALTYALDALSTQVAAGRLVVVISHMLAVAQHVPALLRVSNAAAGSTVRWATDTELLELADEAGAGPLHT
ncbi:exonuclease SbcC [Catenuloplanes nepalensis]|uniref:Nuclease SbcCD subunit C n=1 Tax=Catenuloplanes nepalensis TaxID=587533 RepID=A0ABT9MLZ0_9ACTN|nr:SMC family ATPase [Catenuloplanes nepalensis]MDP9792430.1 exonuclease SbcC [Catenuloplanes nepalensis]